MIGCARCDQYADPEGWLGWNKDGSRVRCRCNPPQVTAEIVPFPITQVLRRVPESEVRDQTVNRYELTERYVMDMFIAMGQPEDAENGYLVGRIAEKLIRAIDLRWAHPNSTLRMSPKRLMTLPGLAGHWRSLLGD